MACMRLSILAVVLCLACPLTAFSASPSAKEAAAVRAAEDFLALVDQGRYGKSWDVAADLLVSRVPKKEWKRTLAGIRPPFGKLTRRAVMSHQFMTSAPGAPDGEYVMILFSTSFANKSAAMETVTTVLEDDGTWRVAGYFIK